MAVVAVYMVRHMYIRGGIYNRTGFGRTHCVFVQYRSSDKHKVSTFLVPCTYRSSPRATVRRVVIEPSTYRSSPQATVRHLGLPFIGIKYRSSGGNDHGYTHHVYVNYRSSPRATARRVARVTWPATRRCQLPSVGWGDPLVGWRRRSSDVHDS